MDNEIALPAWAEDWTARTHIGLYYASTLTFAVLSTSAVGLGLQALMRLRTCRTDMEKDPSSRAALFTACDKRIKSITKSQLSVAAAFATYASVLYMVDLAICIIAVWRDASDHSNQYTFSLAVKLMLHAIGIAGITLATCVVFPLAQLLLFGGLLARHRRGLNHDSTLAAYIPEARIMTTHLGQLWSMLVFCIMAFWPTFEYPTARLLAVAAAFATAMMWLNLSYKLIFNEDLIAELDTDVMTGGGCPAKRLAFASLSASVSGKLLPMYATVNTGEQACDEKQEV